MDGAKKTNKSVILSVRLSSGDFSNLQVLGRVYEKSVGELIRVAVGKHVEEVTRGQEFKARALELKKRNDATLDALIAV